jgi:hypothetical protein
LFIREISCNDEVKKQLEKARFYNDNENDNIEFVNIKKSAKEKLRRENIFIVKVIKIQI